MIVFIATLILIIAAVVARAGVTPSSGSIHSLGGHFSLSCHQLSGPSAGKLFSYGIVVRIAGLLGFSMLPGASTCAPGLPGIAAGPDGIRRETTVRDHGALCLDRDRLAGEPVQRSASRHRQAWARCRTLLRHEANIVIMSVPAAQTAAGRNSDPCGTAVRRCPATGVTAGHHDGESHPGRHHPRERRHGRACGHPQPCGLLGECRSPKSERTALNRPGGRRDTPSRKERR
jgi:hypothetical protein